MKKLILLALFGASFIAARIDAQVTVLYNNDFPTDRMAAATRPESAGKFEIESADDFLLPTGAHITSATFTGLLPSGVAISNVANVRVEIYRVFPNDSDVGRTSGPPTFSTPQVPTRVNSPSDVALLDRSNNDGNLSFTAALLSATFTANNSVQPGGIHPQPGQTTGGNGAITGEEVRFAIDFTNPLNLPPGHYFFVPQVELSGADDNFFWLSATGRSFLLEHRFSASRICKLGLATRIWIRTGSELEPTLSVAIPRRLSTRRSRLRESRRIPAPQLCCWVLLWLRWLG